MRQAILARHGESVFSVRAIMNGDVSVPGGLTPAGTEQARALGVALRDEPLDLCVTSALERTITTADEALAGRSVPRVVMPALNDPLYGPYEGKGLDEYRAWAMSAPSSAPPGAGGESRYAIVERYARAFRELLERPEKSILVVAHSLPIAYALAAREGQAPTARAALVEYASARPFTAAELDRAAGVLEAWLATPAW